MPGRPLVSTGGTASRRSRGTNGGATPQHRRHCRTSQQTAGAVVTMGPAALAESASRRAVMQASSSLQLRAAGASTPASEASLASPPPRNAPTPGQLRGATAATSLRETRAPSFGSRGGTDADEGLGGEEGDFVDKPCLCWGGTVGCEVRRLVGIAAPLSIGYFSSQAIAAIGLSFLGYLDARYLAAAVIGNVVINSLYVGFTAILNAMDPLCAIALSAGKVEKVGMWLQAGVIWATLLFVPVMLVVWCFAGDIMDRVGAEDTEELRHLVNKFGRWSCLWMWPSIAYLCLTIWLETQQAGFATTSISLVGLPLSYVTNALLVNGIGSWNGLGFIGNPVANAVCTTVQLCALALWAFCLSDTVKKLKTRPTLTRKAFRCQHVSQLLRVGFPISARQIVLDWPVEITTVIAATIGATEAAAMGLLINLLFLCQPFFLALYIAVSIRVGSQLSDDNPKHARRVWLTSLGGACVVAVIIGSVITGLHQWVPRMYTSNSDIVDTAAAAVPVVALALVMSSLSYVAQGTLEGQNRSQLATAGAMFGNWLVALPFAYVFAVDLAWGVKGLWWGIVLGEGVRFAFTAGCVVYKSWEDLAADAFAVAEKQEIEADNMLRDMLDSDDSDMDDLEDVYDDLSSDGNV